MSRCGRKKRSPLCLDAALAAPCRAGNDGRLRAGTDCRIGGCARPARDLAAGRRANLAGAADQVHRFPGRGRDAGHHLPVDHGKAFARARPAGRGREPARGGNVIGAQAAARAAPDGYTFFFATAAALVTNPYTFKSLPYDPARDFVPVSMVASNPFFLLANPSLSAKSIPELIALDKNEPGKLAAATDGQRN